MIEINNSWAIGADKDNIILYRKRTSEKNSLSWKVDGYYPDIHSALHGLIRQEIRDTKLASLKDVTDKIDELFALIKSMPNITIPDITKEAKQKKSLSPEHLAKLQAGRNKP